MVNLADIQQRIEGQVISSEQLKSLGLGPDEIARILDIRKRKLESQAQQELAATKPKPPKPQNIQGRVELAQSDVAQYPIREDGLVDPNAVIKEEWGIGVGLDSMA